MKSPRAKYVCGIFLLGAVATCPAQSTWNLFISDAGDGSSLVTWNVTGDLASPPGSALVVNESSLNVTINAPGIFVDSFAANGAPQNIPTPDGSYFETGPGGVYYGLVGYFASNQPGGGNDSFSLYTPALPFRGLLGVQFSYVAGAQSAVIPLAFSDFNPGTYQSQESEFGTPLTVNMTVAPAPEPSLLALCAVGALAGWRPFHRRK